MHLVIKKSLLAIFRTIINIPIKGQTLTSNRPPQKPQPPLKTHETKSYFLTFLQCPLLPLFIGLKPFIKCCYFYDLLLRIVQILFIVSAKFLAHKIKASQGADKDGVFCKLKISLYTTKQKVR